MMKKRLIALGMVVVLALGCVSCGNTGADDKTTTATKENPLDPKKPTTITIWNYYNGDQLAAFDKLIAEFNSTVGVEEGIAIESVSQGSIDNLADSLLDAADKKVGAQDMPTLASVYAETAYILNKKELLVNLDEYFTKDELAEYVPQFIEEGRLVDAGELLLFPVSKSTECFAVNKTDCAEFEKATGASVESIDSLEKLVEVAKQYYEWTDAKTPKVKEDGKALYGRDSNANYIYVGMKQLGHDIFTPDGDSVKVDLDKASMRTLWDNYYIPFINGYFAAESAYRSEDMKTGAILAMTGSTSGVSYLPTEVTDSKDKTHEIDIVVEKPLKFSNGENIAVQQGAGYCVLKGTKQEQYAAAEFLKWFTQPDRNLEFSVASGYSAVTLDANKADKLKEKTKDSQKTKKDENMLNALLISADVYTNDFTYTSKPFTKSRDVRDVLDKALADKAAKDRKAVVKAIEGGMTRAKATAKYTTDEYFDSWYDSLCSQVDKAIQ